MRELLRAVMLKRPIITLLEPEGRYCYPQGPPWSQRGRIYNMRLPCPRLHLPNLLRIRHGGLTHEKIQQELRECRSRFIGWGLDNEVRHWDKKEKLGQLPQPDELYAALFESENVVLVTPAGVKHATGRS